MTKLLYIGLDVHKESIVVATAPEGDTATELHGKIGGTLEALDKLSRNWPGRSWNCVLCMKPGRAVRLPTR